MIRSFKYRIYFNESQETQFLEILCFCKDLYNAALEESNRFYRYYKNLKNLESDPIKQSLIKTNVSFFDQVNESKDLKNIFNIVENIHSQVIQSTIKRVDTAKQNYFRGLKNKNKTAGKPRFKSLKRFKSILFPQCNLKSGGVKLLKNSNIKNNRLKIKGITGEVEVILHRPFQGRCKTVSIKKENDQYFIVLSCDNIFQTELSKTGKITGIDLGISNFITTDAGTTFQHPRPYLTAKHKLADLNRKLAAKQKDSKNRRKALSALQKAHRKVVNIREDFQHKISKQLVKQNDVIIVEKLNIKSMMESKGFQVNKSNIQDASWGNFVSKLKYKAESAGRLVIEVSPANTSKKCSNCYCLNYDLKLSNRIFNCKSCGFAIDRDYNAAINIRRIGKIHLIFS